MLEIGLSIISVVGITFYLPSVILLLSMHCHWLNNLFLSGPATIQHGRTRRRNQSPVYWFCQVLQRIHNHRQEERKFMHELNAGMRSCDCFNQLCKMVYNHLTFLERSHVLFCPQCVLLTYASIATIALFFKLKPKKQAAVTAKWCECIA